VVLRAPSFRAGFCRRLIQRGVFEDRPPRIKQGVETQTGPSRWRFKGKSCSTLPNDLGGGWRTRKRDFELSHLGPVRRGVRWKKGVDGGKIKCSNGGGWGLERSGRGKKNPSFIKAQGGGGSGESEGRLLSLECIDCSTPKEAGERKNKGGLMSVSPL